MTHPKDPQADIREAMEEILQPDRTDYFVKKTTDQILALFQAREQQMIDTVVKYSNALELEWRSYRGSSNYADFAKDFYTERLQSKTNDGGKNV